MGLRPEPGGGRARPPRRLPPGSAGRARAAPRRWGRLLRSRRYDVVHAHWVVPNAAWSRTSSRAHRVPLRGEPARQRRVPGRALGPRRAFCARRAFGGAGARDRLQRRPAAARAARSARPRRARARCPTASTSPPSRPRRDAGRCASGWASPPDALLVLAVGRLVEKKGFASARGGGGRPPGSARRDRRRRAICARASQRRIARARARRCALVGPLDRAAVARALAAADVVAVPSVVDRAGNVDGLPNTLLEALAAGRAVVASRVAGIPDVVDRRRERPARPARRRRRAGGRARATGRASRALRARLGAAARAHAVRAPALGRGGPQRSRNAMPQAAALDAR